MPSWTLFKQSCILKPFNSFSTFTEIEGGRNNAKMGQSGMSMISGDYD
jgi:hypothetical protein